METPIRVLIADDSPDITEMLAFVIGIEPNMECVGSLGSANHLVEEIRSLRPDVVILDANMPGKDPLAVLVEIVAGFPGVKTILYSGYDDPDMIDRVIDAGAWGFVSKGRDPQAVIRAIRVVAAGSIAFPTRRSGSASTNLEPGA